MALKARQRTGFARRASRFLDGRCNAGVYKAIIRPNLEYAHLAWMGSAPSNLRLLDEVQLTAEKIIGPSGPVLDTLEHRRKVGALTYLFKLHCWNAPPRMQRMIPPRLPRPPLGRTRASRTAYESWHPYKLAQPLDYRSLDNALRAFLFGVIDTWNSLPAWFFDAGFDLKNMQTFKARVHQFLGGKIVLNPALARLRARGIGYFLSMTKNSEKTNIWKR